MTKQGIKGENTDPKMQQLTEKEDEHNRFCLSGIARTSLRCGQLRRGLDICTGKALRTNKVCFVFNPLQTNFYRTYYLCPHEKSRKAITKIGFPFYFQDITTGVCRNLRTNEAVK